MANTRPTQFVSKRGAHKFKRLFYTHKPVLNVRRFKDFWYTTINLNQKYILLSSKPTSLVLFIHNPYMHYKSKCINIEECMKRIHCMCNRQGKIIVNRGTVNIDYLMVKLGLFVCCCL